MFTLYSVNFSLSQIAAVSKTPEQVLRHFFELYYNPPCLIAVYSSVKEIEVSLEKYFPLKITYELTHCIYISLTITPLQFKHFEALKEMIS